MKKIYLMLLIAFTSYLCNAQWSVNYGGIQTETLRSAYFLNGSSGYVVGGNEFNPGSALILKTNDGGINWTPQVAGVDTGLRAVYSIDENTSIACGFAGNIIKTTDGGANWVLKASGTINTLRSMYFTSATVGFICGSAGTLLKTTDAGETWTQVANSGTTQDLINIRFASASIGYCVSSTSAFASGIVLKTTDGGDNWSSVYTNIQGLLGLAVIDANTIFAGGGNNQGVGGYSYIVKSTDGGANWTEVFDGLTNFYSFRTGFFVSATTGWFGGDGGQLMKTTDGGASWTSDSVNSLGIFGIFFPNADTGYAVGGSSIILKYAPSCQPFTEIGNIEGGLSACAGDTVAFSVADVTGATNYTWSVPGDAVILTGQGQTEILVVLGSTSGTVSVQAESSCDSIISSLELTVNPLPPIPVITFTDDILYSSASTGNQWYFNGAIINGATGATYTPTQDGSYTVVVTNSNGCSATSQPFSVIGTGIATISPATVFMAFPNPFESFTILTAANNGDFENAKLIITNMQGVTIRTTDNIYGSEIKIIRESLSPGIYFYRILDAQDHLIATGKLIAQ